MMCCMRLLLGRESKCIYDLVPWPEARSLDIFYISTDSRCLGVGLAVGSEGLCPQVPGPWTGEGGGIGGFGGGGGGAKKKRKKKRKKKKNFFFFLGHPPPPAPSRARDSRPFGSVV